MNYRENINRFFDDLLKTSTDTGFRRFFYRSRSTVLVTLLIASTKKNSNLSLEGILEAIPRQISSRTTIKSILDEGVIDGFFEKRLHQKDNRRRVYSLRSEYNNEIKEWVERQKTIFQP